MLQPLRSVAYLFLPFHFVYRHEVQIGEAVIPPQKACINISSIMLTNVVYSFRNVTMCYLETVVIRSGDICRSLDAGPQLAEKYCGGYCTRVQFILSDRIKNIRLEDCGGALFETTYLERSPLN